jgi:choline dehydrogenase-like flavoprotein
VCVVGGGLCGLAVADQLRRRRIDCLLLEAGPSPSRQPSHEQEKFQAATNRVLQVDEKAWRFRSIGLPYDWIRVRALGGRSLLWGGWCERMDSQNFRDARALGRLWPVSLQELAPYYRVAERRLRVRKGLVSAFHRQITHKLGLEVIAKRSAMIPTKTRAICGLDLPRPARLRTAAVALRLERAAGKVQGVEVFDKHTGIRHLIAAKTIVLCTSPIETTRLLLASGIGGSTGLVGKGLVDHLVATCMVLLPRPAPSSGPLGPLQRCALVPRFVNVGRTRKRNYRSGFTVEVVGPIALNQLGTMGVRSLGLDAKTAQRFSYCLIHSIGEVYPHESRFVTLDANERDSFGRAIPVVNLAWCDEQRAMANDMEETVATVADALAPPNSRIIRLRETLHPGGIAHEAGTARMGKNREEGITDPWGAVFDVQGLYIADASVMPTALDRHPTLTVMALALRTADRVAKDYRHAC